MASIKYAVQVVRGFRLTVRVLAGLLTFFEWPYTTTMLRCTMGIPAARRSNWSWINASCISIENDELVS